MASDHIINTAPTQTLRPQRLSCCIYSTYKEVCFTCVTVKRCIAETDLSDKCAVAVNPIAVGRNCHALGHV
ncbi:MAG: hypothetical protein ACK55I_14195, partial [bacterium]